MGIDDRIFYVNEPNKIKGKDYLVERLRELGIIGEGHIEPFE